MSAEAQKHPDNILAGLGKLLPDLEAVYKDIHSHPELSMQETRSAGIAPDHNPRFAVAAQPWLQVQRG